MQMSQPLKLRSTIRSKSTWIIVNSLFVSKPQILKALCESATINLYFKCAVAPDMNNEVVNDLNKYGGVFWEAPDWPWRVWSVAAQLDSDGINQYVALDPTRGYPTRIVTISLTTTSICSLNLLIIPQLRLVAWELTVACCQSYDTGFHMSFHFFQHFSRES